MQSRSSSLARILRGVTPSHTANRYAVRALTTSLSHPTARRQQHLSISIRQLPTLATTTTVTQTRYASSSSSESRLQKTPLYSLHLAHGAKMVPFGGFHMPVQYASLSVAQSHLFTRSHASVFDVSHMVQRLFRGPGAAQFLQSITPSGVEALAEHRSTLSCLLKEDGSGGIVDDTIITRLGGAGGEIGEGFYVVTNAACQEKDDVYLDREVAKWNREMTGKGLGVREERLNGRGLVALQGPGAEGVLAGVLAEEAGLDLRKLLFGQSAYARLKLGVARVSRPVLISRGGYTGEDGFEISIPGDEAVAVTEALLAAGPGKVQLAGLGARDSLRLEAGMCLYGHDLDESTTPVEAGLSWIIPKERRTADAGFYGADVIAKQLVAKSKGGSGVARRRVGLIVEGAPAREGAEIVSRAEEGKEPVKLGAVTSGCPSPSLGKNIAMGYVKDGFHKAGTEVDVLVRGRPRKAVVAKMPFVPTKYWKGET
ncbi:glycine cleavage system T protein [Parathielavia appendiculata]|uniref:Aminomethyltransferase n=1 Tax=Parathielavia appendiculata TaxID=2587402 RepID=A0AAN6U990_9PEZI|nr:glycine cleavage system T protein [Parathielavia appendiculata]